MCIYLDVEEKTFHGVGEGVVQFDEGYEYRHTHQRITYHCTDTQTMP